MSEATLATWIQEKADQLALALDDEEAILRRLAELVVEEYPERSGKAVWMDVEGRTDQGLTLTVYERPLGRMGASLDLVLGRDSVGGMAFVDVADRKLWPETRATVSIGAGAVRWFDTDVWSFVGGVRVTV